MTRSDRVIAQNTSDTQRVRGAVVRDVCVAYCLMLRDMCIAYSLMLRDMVIAYCLVLRDMGIAYCLVLGFRQLH